MVMTDIMVDIETTGTDPQHTNMIQLAAIQFNYETGEIGPIFNRCLEPTMNRYWSESTRAWWGSDRTRATILQSIMQRAECPIKVMNDYFDYARNPDRPLRFWSRGSFDFNFVESYLNQYQLPMPHRFNEQRDLRSFQGGAYRNGGREPDLSHITAEGNAHDALFDCVIQLKCLFAVRDLAFHEILPPEGDAIAS